MGNNAEYLIPAYQNDGNKIDISTNNSTSINNVNTNDALDGFTNTNDVDHTHLINVPSFIGSSGSTGVTETRPKNIAVNYIIKC